MYAMAGRHLSDGGRRLSIPAFVEIVPIQVNVTEAVLHNAVVAWNMIQIARILAELRAEGHQFDDETVSHATPLMRKHINPLGRYYFDLSRMRQDLDHGSEANP
jgi:hypothetical protein